MLLTFRYNDLLYLDYNYLMITIKVMIVHINYIQCHDFIQSMFINQLLNGNVVKLKFSQDGHS